jgi:cobalt/nickel transport system permease protein
VLPAEADDRGLDPRLRVVLALAFAIVTVALGSLPALAAALAFSIVVVVVGRAPVASILRRAAAVDGVIVAVIVILPFTTPGEPMLQAGPLTATWEGLRRGVDILLTATAVMLVCLATVGTMEPVTLGHALHRLGMPQRLVVLLFLTVRYLGVLGEEYGRLRLAMRARAFRPRSDRHTWRSFGYLVGMVLVRALDRSERIVAAMKCRGFRGDFPILDDLTATPRDAAVGAAWLAGLAGLIAIDGL